MYSPLRIVLLLQNSYDQSFFFTKFWGIIKLFLSEYWCVKVRTFWEAHKNLRNLPHALYIYLGTIFILRKGKWEGGWYS